jgi:hypothetical protein
VTATVEAPEQAVNPLWRGPGLYTADELSLEAYHRDIVPGGSLSSSGARKLLAPGCPAQFKYDLDHGEAPKKIWDLGTAAHKLVLGDGPELVVVDRARWDTNEAKAEVATIRAAGNIPLKRPELEQVQAMAQALREHPEAGWLLDPNHGTPEQSVFWEERALDITRRARTDWLRHDGIVVDYKGLALDTPIPTPSGWTTMRAIQVGDEVFDSTGAPCKVTEKSEVHWRRCYRVRFDDASSVVCDDDHLWVTTAGTTKRTTEVRSTEEIRRTLTFRGQHHHRVKVAGALEAAGIELPINPYVLGCWLGDGAAAAGRITKPDEELFDLIAACGYKIGPPVGKEKCPTRTIYGLQAQLRAAGLLGHKRIPGEYLRAAPEQRLALLRGLMDTDGSWNATRQQAVFTSTDKALALAVRELACTLGQRAILNTSTQHGFGVVVEAYQVTFRPICGMNPFLLARKADKVQVRSETRSRQRIVVAVDEMPTVPTQCIAVDSPDRTYLCTEAMIPTHNTTRSADLDAISKTVHEHGYHAQADWYLDGLKAQGYATDDTPFIFIFQQKTAPYIVTVVRLDDLAMRIGHDLNQAAMQLYANCRAADHWPGHSEITEVVSLPAWVERLYS